MLKSHENNKISMVEGDYGISLPLTINGITIDETDKLNFFIKDVKGEKKIIDQTYEQIKNNTFDLKFSKEESDKLKVGKYRYAIDWYKENKFNCNIIKNNDFQVEDKI